MEEDHSAQQRQGSRLRKLIEANQVLAQVESLPDLLPRLLELAQDVTDAVASSILLYDVQRQCLRFALARNDTPGIAERILTCDFELCQGEGIAGTVAQTRKPLLCGEDDPRIRRDADAVTGFRTRSVLCVPILYKEELLGVAQVLNPRQGGMFTPEDLDILESFAHLAGVALVRSRLLEALLEQERINTQLQAAARIQEAFQPRLPDMAESHIWARSHPAIHVGGDMYDCIILPDGRMAAYIADVAGKGLGAALVGAAVWSRMRSLALEGLSPSIILKRMNEMLLNDMENALFVTLCVAVYDKRNHTAQLANAGHLMPLRLHGATVEEIPLPPGLPLGIEPEVSYQEYSISLSPGEAVLLISDGITEARNADREMFGEERVTALLRRKGAAPYGEALMQGVLDWQRGVAANDDRTVLELWRDNRR